jgi:hypothetical protein
MSVMTAAITTPPPTHVISDGVSPNPTQTQNGASGVSSDPIKAERVAEIRRVPSVSSSRPTPNCAAPNSTR